MIALRERNFRLYWLGQAVSNTGNWMQVVALGWFVLQLNGSPIALGWLGLAQFLPIAGLSLVGGVLADHFPRRSLLLVTQSMAMLLACMLALLAWSGSGKPPLWSLLLIATLASIVTSIDNPARQAFLGDLVGKEAMLNAVALNAGVYNGAAVIGPSLAGLLLLHVGAAGCFALNAVSFLAVIIALLSIVPGKQSHTLMGYKEDDISLVSSTQRPSPLRAFWNLRRERIIMAVLAIAAIVSLLGRPYLLLLPAFAKTVQHVGPQGLGLMTAASGLGSLLGALFLAALKSSKRLERLLLICGVGFGLMLLLFALTSTLLLALLVLAGCGMGATMSMMVANTMLQTQAPAGMRGRVMSLYTLIAAGFTQAGVLILSGLSILIHLSGATVIAGIAVALAAMLGVRSIARNRSSGGKA